MDPAPVSMPKFGQSSTSTPNGTSDGIEAGDEHGIKRELPSSPTLVRIHHPRGLRIAYEAFAIYAGMAI